MAASLEELRREIASVDAAMVELVASRLALAAEVGEAKRVAGLPVRSFSTEAEVLERFQRLGAAAGLDERLAERIAHLLIGAAVRVQETSPGTGAARGLRILLVGGAGKIGRWFAEFFAGQGHRVSTLDPAGPVAGFPVVSDLATGVHAAEAIIITTPLTVGREVLDRVLGLAPDGLVADAFSLKSHVLDLLRGAAGRGLRVASLHPLFGPGVRTLSGRIMAVCDCGNATAADEAAALFTDTALTITRLPVARHDEYMQYVLGLSHLVAILFFTTLARSGRSYEDLAQVASTTFLKEARTAAEVSRENPGLYFEIQRLNLHSAELFALVRSCLGEIEIAALADDPARFEQVMRDGRTFFPESLPAELG